MQCFTCKIIEAVEKSYPVRDAVFGKSSGRCQWHAWDDDNVFVCSQCSTSHFFEKIAWCKKTDNFICTECAPSRTVRSAFWVWKKYISITCPFCGNEHPTLNRQEFEGAHPWQADPYQCKQFPIWYPDGTQITEEDVKKQRVACPYCRTYFTIKNPGTYQCPHCHRPFTVRKKSL